MVSNSVALPFGMIFRDNSKADERGFTIPSESSSYDAKNQVSDVVMMAHGTWSKVTTTTSGFFGRGDDPDDKVDDK